MPTPRAFAHRAIEATNLPAALVQSLGRNIKSVRSCTASARTIKVRRSRVRRPSGQVRQTLRIGEDYATSPGSSVHVASEESSAFRFEHPPKSCESRKPGPLGGDGPTGLGIQMNRFGCSHWHSLQFWPDLCTQMCSAATMAYRRHRQRCNWPSGCCPRRSSDQPAGTSHRRQGLASAKPPRFV
jgi:hypothetical protein